MRAGLGFGGFCLPKDIQAFIRLAERAGMDFALLKEAERINKQRIDRFMEKARQLAVGGQRQAKVGCWAWRLSPTPTTSGFAPAIELIRRLLGRGAL